MSIFKEYSFLAASTDNIATTQTISHEAEIIFNGSLAKSDGSSVDFINDYGFVPRITFTSAEDISQCTLIIKGKQNGITITEDIIGPNNETVTTVNCFDSIESIFFYRIINI